MIKIIKNRDLQWDFQNKDPYFRLYNHRVVYVDPFPCYRHNLELTSGLIQEVESKFYLQDNITYFLSEFEAISRTNATAYSDLIHEPGSSKIVGVNLAVSFSGKRTCIHPCMTKYLCSHEYGHLVQYFIEWKSGISADYKRRDEFEIEYAKMRNIEFNNEYGGRKWHSNTGEIIANDFRICITGMESEYYPHDCTHPLLEKKVQDFWSSMKKEYSNC